MFTKGLDKSNYADHLADAFAFAMQTRSYLDIDEEGWPVPPSMQRRKTIDLSPDEYREVQDLKELPDGN